MGSIDAEGRTELGWADVDACTLPTAERPLRVGDFDELFAGSLLRVERPSDERAVLVLAGGEGLAQRVQDLADAESACCSFFTFTVSSRLVGGAPPVVVLDIAVPPTYAAVLTGLVQRAGRAAAAQP